VGLEVEPLVVDPFRPAQPAGVPFREPLSVARERGETGIATGHGASCRVDRMNMGRPYGRRDAEPSAAGHIPIRGDYRRTSAIRADGACSRIRDNLRIPAILSTNAVIVLALLGGALIAFFVALWGGPRRRPR